ncbi:hypothetical protein BC936DRAFT_141565 [Jimgerdemannia flammicorona]|uniref:polynucleotide adenylyltransferase n=1 Tax=Jimgerdemannia flammicorona TaxID=994334 RepID=A0A433A213_9FUNG|nr:hypothetical protein BC936DRAFT_141565 [Jimgerdemannia flammicorona]
MTYSAPAPASAATTVNRDEPKSFITHAFPAPSDTSSNGVLPTSDPSVAYASIVASSATTLLKCPALSHNCATDAHHHHHLFLPHHSAHGTLSNDNSTNEEGSDGALSNIDALSDTTDTTFSQEEYPNSSIASPEKDFASSRTSPPLVPVLPLFLSTHPMLTTAMAMVEPSLVGSIPITLPWNQEDNLSVQMLQLFEVRLLFSFIFGPDCRGYFLPKLSGLAFWFSLPCIQLYFSGFQSSSPFFPPPKATNVAENLWPKSSTFSTPNGLAMISKCICLGTSSENNLGTSNSDVDICVTTPWTGLRNVYTLAKGLKKHGMQKVYCVPRAKVPIVKMEDPSLDLACDINVNNTLALQNTRMIKTYVEIDPRVRPLAMIIKHWARQRVLNDAANGGTLSTYTWTCMIINFLQMREPPILPTLHQIPHDPHPDNIVINGLDSSFFDDVEALQGYGERNKESLGGLLFAFFRRYAIEFDYEHHVVSVRQGRYLTKEEKGWDQGRLYRLLCVEEPFNVSRNLGNSADDVSVHGLQQEFKRALDILAGQCDLDLVCQQYVFPNYLRNNYEDGNRGYQYYYQHSKAITQGHNHGGYHYHYNNTKKKTCASSDAESCTSSFSSPLLGPSQQYDNMPPQPLPSLSHPVRRNDNNPYGANNYYYSNANANTEQGTKYYPAPTASKSSGYHIKRANGFQNREDGSNGHDYNRRQGGNSNNGNVRGGNPQSSQSTPIAYHNRRRESRDHAAAAGAQQQQNYDGDEESSGTTYRKNGGGHHGRRKGQHEEDKAGRRGRETAGVEQSKEQGRKIGYANAAKKEKDGNVAVASVPVNTSTSNAATVTPPTPIDTAPRKATMAEVVKGLRKATGEVITPNSSTAAGTR